MFNNGERFQSVVADGFRVSLGKAETIYTGKKPANAGYAITPAHALGGELQPPKIEFLKPFGKLSI